MGSTAAIPYNSYEERSSEGIDSETEDEGDGSQGTGEYSAESERERADAGDAGSAEFCWIPPVNASGRTVRRAKRRADGRIFLGKEDAKLISLPVRRIPMVDAQRLEAGDVEGKEEEIRLMFTHRTSMLFVDGEALRDLCPGKFPPGLLRESVERSVSDESGVDPDPTAEFREEMEAAEYEEREPERRGAEFVLIPVARKNNHEVRRVMRKDDGSIFLGKEDVKRFWAAALKSRNWKRMEHGEVNLGPNDLEGDEGDARRYLNNHSSMLFVDGKALRDTCAKMTCKYSFPPTMLEQRSGVTLEAWGDEPTPTDSGKDVPAGLLLGGNDAVIDLTTELQEEIEAKESEQRELENKLEELKRDAEELKVRKSFADDWNRTVSTLMDLSAKRKRQDIGSRRNRLALDNLKECAALLRSELEGGRSGTGSGNKKRRLN